MVGEVDADHQAAAAHLAEIIGCCSAQRPEAGEQLVADGGGVVRQPALDEVERGDRGRAGDRVAAERRAVLARAPSP